MFMDLYYRLAETHKGDLMNQLYFRKQNNNILYHLVISLSSSFIMGSGLLWNNLTPACLCIHYYHIEVDVVNLNFLNAYCMHIKTRRGIYGQIYPFA